MTDLFLGWGGEFCDGRTDGLTDLIGEGARELTFTRTYTLIVLHGSEVARDFGGKSRRFNLPTPGLQHGGWEPNCMGAATQFGDRARFSREKSEIQSPNWQAAVASKS